MRFLKGLIRGINKKGIQTVTVVVFLAISVFAMAFGMGALNRGNLPADTDSETLLILEDYSDEVVPQVTTKAQNTGDPVMTTTIIEYTYYESVESVEPEETTVDVDTTVPVETTTVRDTTAKVTTKVTASAKVTEETTAAVTTTETTADTSGTAEPDPEENEPVCYDDGQWNLILVNPWNPLPDGFTTPELVSVSDSQQADYRVKDALEAMLADCRKAGYNPYICSSYRTVARQKTLFENETKAFMEYGYDRAAAEEYAAKWVARPGTSEHHTGLAFDIVSKSYQKLDRSQADTPEQKWLMANCHKYGFILRYPDNKTEITGIYYEPWHYRYVGIDAATVITENGICFEEYLDIINTGE